MTENREEHINEEESELKSESGQSKYVIPVFKYDISVTVPNEHNVVTNVQRRNRQLREQLDQLEDKVYHVEVKNQEFTKKIQMNESENNNYKGKIEECKKIVENLKNQMSNEGKGDTILGLSERNALEEKMTLLQFQLEQSKISTRNLIQIAQDNEEMRRTISSLVSETRELEEKKKEHELKNDNNSKNSQYEIDRLKQNNSRLMERIQHEINVERERGQNAINLVKEEYKNKYKALEAEIEDLKKLAKGRKN